MNGSRLAIVIPTYNNAKLIGEIVKKCLRYTAQVIVVDDGSTDDSGKIAKLAGATVLHHPKNQGKSAALQTAFHFINQKLPEAETILTVDADGQHDPDNIPRLTETFDKNRGLVIGERSLSELKRGPLWRFWGNRVISFAISIILGEKISDTQSGFRAFPVSLIRGRTLSSKKYSAETEILFWAKRAGLEITEVPISSPPSLSHTASFSGDLLRLFDILAVIFRETIHQLTFSNLLKMGILALVAWQVVILFGKSQEKMADEASYFMQTRASEALDYETTAAFSWLKNNTPQDAIIIAPFYDGHRIMAFADRRVIASGKVYSSETIELAARLRDLSRFFFATDFEEAKKIADRYQAQYVFLSRPVLLTPQLCEPAKACHFATYKPYPGKEGLTPDGMRKTLIGKFLSEAELSEFKLVWSSPRFLIYRIVSNTPLSTCETDYRARKQWIRAVRTLLMEEKTTFPEELSKDQCGLNIGLWRNGEKIGNLTLAGISKNEKLKILHEYFGQGLKEMSQSEKDGVQIEIAIWDTTQEIIHPIVPFSTYQELAGNILRLKVQALNPEQAIFAIKGSRKARVLPSMWADNRFGESLDFSQLIQQLCLEIEAGEECWKNKEVNFGTVPVTSWIEEEKSGGVLPLFGPVAIRQELNELPPKLLRERAKSALDSLLRDVLRENLYKYYPPEKIFHVVPALLTGHEEFKDKAYLDGAIQAFGQGKRKAREQNTNSLAASSEALVASLRLWQSTKNLLYLTTSREMFAELLATEKPSANARAQVLYTLSEYGLRMEDEAVFKKLDEDARTLLEDFLYRKEQAIFQPEEREVPFREKVSLTSVFSNLFKISKNTEYANTALALTKWLGELQNDPFKFGMGGSFQHSPISSDVSTETAAQAAFAISSVLPLASKDEALYEELLKSVLVWLMQMQYDEKSLYFMEPQRRADFAGALRTSPWNQQISAPATADFVAATINYLSYLKGAQKYAK